jgi:hypothetical protein
VVAEALTRLIQRDATIKGIEINRANIKMSQFADDTQIFAETYENITKALRWVAIYERATGSKVNAHKYVGIKARSTLISMWESNGAQPKISPLH